MRYELKFLLPKEHFSGLVHQLTRRLQLDPHSGEDGYRIRSLYLDTYDRKAYFEKLDGVYHRTKTRIRFYDDDLHRGTAELKIKEGNRGFKMRWPCPGWDESLSSTGIRRHIRSVRDQCQPFYSAVSEYGLEPSCWIVYDRRAFIDPRQGLRVTMDYNLKASSTRRPRRMMKIIGSECFVVEVKYGDHYPAWLQRLMASLGQNRMAISKYGMGLARLARYQGHA